MKKLIQLSIVYILVLFSTSGFTADISNSDTTPRDIIFKGDIVAGDYQRLLTLIDAKMTNNPSETQDWMQQGEIWIMSSGGDVQEAMKLGRLIREKRYGIRPFTCHSSCVYLLAAGLEKQVTKNNSIVSIGIHRPYFTVSQGSNTDTIMKQILIESRKYFEFMNIPPSLADEIFSILPENIKILNDNELQKYRLNQEDLAYKDRIDLFNASKYGMTRQEFFQAKELYSTDVKIFCTSLSDESIALAYANEGKEAVNKLAEEYRKCIGNFRYKHGLFEKK